MKKILVTLICLLALAVSNQALAKFVFTNTGYFGKGNSYAIEGYDATAYLLKGKPVKGIKKHKLKYKGGTWLFASAENKTLFEANPTKYAPQYGGACAWREAQDGVEVYGDPKIWTLLDGKLYLNYNNKVNRLWKKDIPGFIKTANEYWLKEFDALN